MANSKRVKRVTEKVLKRFYYSLDKPSAFTGAQNLMRELKKAGYAITTERINQFLSSQSTYVLYRGALNKYARRKSTGALMKPGLCVFCDLWDVTKYASNNNGYKWILVLVGKLSINVQVYFLTKTVFQIIFPNYVSAYH